MRDRTELEPLTTRLEVELGRRLRMLATTTRVSVQELVNRYVREGLDRQERGDE